MSYDAILAARSKRVEELEEENESIKDELEMVRFSNLVLAKEGYASRDEAESLKKALKASKSNTSLVLSCEAGLENIIKDKNDEISDLEEKAKHQAVSINLLKADLNTLKQQLYVKRYPEQELIDALNECKNLQKDNTVLEMQFRCRDSWFLKERDKVLALEIQVANRDTLLAKEKSKLQELLDILS